MIQITARGNSAQCTRAERLTSGNVPERWRDAVRELLEV